MHVNEKSFQKTHKTVIKNKLVEKIKLLDVVVINSVHEKDDDSLHETPIFGTSLPSMNGSRSLSRTPSRTSTKSPSKSHETTSAASFIETTPLIHEIQGSNPTSQKHIVFETPQSKTTSMDPFDSGIDSGVPKPQYTGHPRHNFQQNFLNTNNSNSADAKGRRRNLNSTSSQGAFAQTPVTNKPLSKTQINMIITFLCMFNLVNYMDRYTIIAVADTYLKPLFGLQEKSIGLISSIFIISYMCMSPIAGYLGDRTNRKWLIVGGAVIWMTCVAVGSFIPDETEEDRAKAWNYSAFKNFGPASKFGHFWTFSE